MRARTWGIVAAVVLTAGTMLVGCPAFHDDYPGTTCKVDTDCYMGEMCTSGTCTAVTPPGDMAVKMFNFDFAMPDMTSCDDDAGGCPDLAGGGDM